MLGDDPAMDYHPIQPGGDPSKNTSWSLHTTETEITAGLMDHLAHMHLLNINLSVCFLSTKPYTLKHGGNMALDLRSSSP